MAHRAARADQAWQRQRLEQQENPTGDHQFIMWEGRRKARKEKEGRRSDGVDPATGSVRPGAGGHNNGEPEVEDDFADGNAAPDPDTTGSESAGRSNGEAEAEEEAFQFVSQLQDLPEHEIHRALFQRHREQLDLMVARHYGGEAGPTPLVPPLLGPGLSFEDAEGGDHSGE